MKSVAVARTVPIPLRLFHGVALVGFSASAVAASGAELQQLYVALAYPYHCGTDPNWLSVAGAGLALITLSAVLLGWWVKRPLPLLVSLLVLVGFGMSLKGMGEPYSRRTPSGANLSFLDLGRVAFDTCRKATQANGIVPTDLADWNRMVGIAADAQQLGSPYRKDLKQVLPFNVQWSKSEDDFPREALPGTILVWVDPEKSRFTLRLIGLDDFHQPALLKDETGAAFALRGGAKDDIF